MRPQLERLVAQAGQSTTGWPVGFWAAELTHPYYEFTRVRYDVTVASPDGGKVEVDALSDPRDESEWSADDLISMGFLNTPELTKLLEDTPKLADLDLDEFDAIVVCGGEAPMFQFRQNEDLKRAIAAFYEAEKPTALLCHGVSALIDVQLSDGSYLAEGKTVTGFANVEEDYSDKAVGQKVMPYRIEDELRKRGANYIQGGLLKAFAVRDGRLITGQQQYSAREGGRARDRRTRNLGEKQMTAQMTDHKIGTREEWRAAREQLLVREKEHTRLGDELARQRRELPWLRVENDYGFDTDDGEKSLVELFDNRSQLCLVCALPSSALYPRKSSQADIEGMKPRESPSAVWRCAVLLCSTSALFPNSSLDPSGPAAATPRASLRRGCDLSCQDTLTATVLCQDALTR